ncbi:protein-tyrosine-phosphatase [Caenorhabditis elegans]|uniref:protein-tyrosine-phosphatase n=1 Tax=Caenorhabditis elegans TaxID=6239 RepID=L8E7X5_CAEEL|nr:protein-tyrosine-phosphatase [Caenorhabditis elegans]CCQ25649.1 protein-tyrosine-phosphatase [Caenorhabditis elegans]|eukprot:NP_001263672.1 Protein-tyrosine-phosphatase [Caenorhabditis elegans]
MNRIARHLRNVARRKGSSLLLFLMLSTVLVAAKEDGKLGEEDEDFGWNDEEPPDNQDVQDGGIPLVRKEEFTNNQLYAEAYQSYIQALAYPARLVVRPDSSTVVDESKISFFCRADGNPLPSVIWRVNGKSITDHNRISIKSLATGLSTLRFERVSLDDNATVVSCSADNGVANPVVAEASLTVVPRDKVPIGFPQIELHPSLKSVEQGKTAYVSCRVRGDPRAKVLWLRDLIPLDIRADGRYSVSTIGNPGALMIQHAREEDQGKYECIARNTLGVAHSKAANLYVKVRRVPPYFSYKLERQYVVGVGGNINLTCVAVGYPMPRVFWKKTDLMVLDDPSTAPIGKNVLTLTHVESTENFTCVAVSALGNIEATTTVIAKELPPPPVNIVVSSVTSESVVITWKPPKYNEAINKYVVNYRLKYSEGRSSRGKTMETLENSLVIDGLVAFQTYEFTVRSAGPVGVGLESLPVEAQTKPSKPATAPVSPQARSLNRDSILVKWGPCEQPNGLITGYKVYYTNDLVTTPIREWKQHDAKSDEFMTTINGLEPDSRYFVRVIAQNSEGDSPLSTLVTVATRQGIPGQPPMLTVKALDSRRMQLTWDKPLYSSPVVGYTVRYNTSDGEKELTLTSPHEKHVVTGLHPDKYYYFRVAAYSDRGQGEFTEPMISKTIASIPLSSPTIVSAAATSSKSVEIRWKGPEQKKLNGVLTAYRINYFRLEDSKTANLESVEYDEDMDDSSSFLDRMSVVVPSDATSYVLSDLLPYSSYEITVAASTMDGYGPESSIRVVKTLEDVPSAPRNFNAELTSATSVKLTWDAPAAANGALLGYYVYLDRMVNGEPVVEKGSKKRIVMIRDSSKRYFELDSLDPNTEYSFRLNAFNRNGDGEFSERKSIITQGIPPEAPEIVSVSLDRDEPPVVARIEWKMPKMKPNETPIEKYNLWLRAQGYPDSYVKAKTVDGTDLSTTISGLWMGVVYDVLLAAENREGRSQNATETIATPVGSPDGEPIDVQYEVMKGKIVVSWRPPSEEKRNGNITSYKAILSAMDATADRYEQPVPAPSTSSTFEVNVRRAYLFKVAAATMKGIGPYSPVLTINPDPAALVGPPTNVRVEATSNSTAVVQWDFESQKADSFVVKYMHEPGNRMDTEKWKQLPVVSIDKENPKRFAVVSDLNAHKPYAFCVLAVKNNRQGPCSDPPTVLESVTPTYMVQNLRVLWKTSNSVQLTWEYNGPRNVGFYVNHTGRKDYVNHELQEKTMSTPGFGQDVDEKHREYLWTNLRPHMMYTIHVGVRTLPPGARKYWPQEVVTITDPTGPPFVDVPKLVDSSGTQPGQQMIRLTPATEEYGPISHYWIILVPANYSTEDVVNLDPIELEKATAEKRAQLARSLSVSPSKKLKRKASEVGDDSQSASYHPKEKRARRATVPGAYVTARLSADRVKQQYRNNQPFIVGDSQLYDGFTNYPLEHNLHYRLMMRAFAKNDVRTKDSFEQRAPMSEKLSRMYSDSVLTEPFTIKSALRGASQKSSPWVGACIAFLVLFSIVGMLICWWLRCNKKSAGRHPRHGSITKVALTGNIMNGGGGIPGETSKLLSTSNEYGRQIMNPYEQMNGNHHMESSMDLYPLPTSHSRSNGYAPVPVAIPSLPNNGNNMTTVSHPAVPIAELANHIERLRMNNNAGFQSEFESIETGQHFTWEHSSADMNKHKNRYANVAAYDHSRVVLSNVEGYPGMDYINANYVDGYDKPRSYIATQGPLPETFSDFWRMVWEEQSVTIVMLTNLEERSRVKCDQYWPSRGTATYGDIEVTLLESVHLAHYTMRTMRLKMVGEPEVREIKHLQYTAWPDHGVPDHPTPFLIFLKRVKTLNPNDAGPIISHCSAGIGRTGAFIVIDCMLERLRYDNTVDIYGCVTALRAQRSYMVQTEEQYIFIHDAVLDAVNSGSTEVPASRLHQHLHILSQPSADQLSGIDMEFRHLTTLKWTSNRCTVANLPVNRPKNRMLSAVPYDSNRVIMRLLPGADGSDYINASWIDGYKERGAYIATQAPTNETAADFWRAIWEHNSPIIAMLVRTNERGQEQCSDYWPLETGVQVGMLVVEPMAEYDMKHYHLREFRISDINTREVRTVRQFHFMEWPDVGKPHTADHFLDFVTQVHNTYAQFGCTGPITVHCCSGAGRTAVFIALSIILDRMRAEHVVDVFTTVKLLRTERQNMIQEPEQYHFLYLAAYEYLAAYDNFS